MVKARAFKTGALPSGMSSVFAGKTLALGSGMGLKATYFNKPDFTGQSFTRIDPLIDFGWPNNSPGQGFGPEYWSARWEGSIEIPLSATYTFSTITDDGIRLWIDGKTVIDHWDPHGPTVDHGSIALEGGKKHDIKIDFYQNGGGSDMHLLWSTPCLQSGVVPTSQLYPAP